jgi:hypothetical protein
MSIPPKKSILPLSTVWNLLSAVDRDTSLKIDDCRLLDLVQEVHGASKSKMLDEFAELLGEVKTYPSSNIYNICDNFLTLFHGVHIGRGEGGGEIARGLKELVISSIVALAAFAIFCYSTPSFECNSYILLSTTIAVAWRPSQLFAQEKVGGNI